MANDLEIAEHHESFAFEIRAMAPTWHDPSPFKYLENEVLFQVVGFAWLQVPNGSDIKWVLT